MTGETGNSNWLFTAVLKFPDSLCFKTLIWQIRSVVPWRMSMLQED